MIFGLIAYALVQFSFSAFDIKGENPSGGEETNDVGNVGTDTGGEVISPDDWLNISGKSFTMLLVGTDFEPSFYTDYDESARNETDENGFQKEPREVEADTVILVRVNKETGECLYCAIPADTKITIGGLPSRLEELYSKKGIDALCEKVMALTGLPIDYYAVVSIDDFISVIDKLGGITYYVKTNMRYIDEEKGLDIDIRKGSQKLNGKKALDMLRYCEYSDGDVSRRELAVDFLKVLVKKILDENNYADAIVVYNEYQEYFETNFTMTALGNNVDLIFAYPKMTVKDYIYPGVTVGEGEDSYFSPNTSKAIEFFSQYKFKG